MCSNKIYYITSLFSTKPLSYVFNKMTESNGKFENGLKRQTFSHFHGKVFVYFYCK